MNQELQKEFLEFISDIREIESIFPDLTDPRLNIFEAAGLVRQEIRHSNLLAFLLSPNSEHGLGDLLLRELIFELVSLDKLINKEFSPSPLDIALTSFGDLIVRREDMHLDLLCISSESKLITVIENKIGAGEGKDQLTRYKTKIRSDDRYRDYKFLFIYLTPFEEEPSDEDWIALSYQTVAGVLEGILEKYKTSIKEDTKFLLNQYIALIRKFILKDIDEELKKACQKIYQKHKKVIDLINEYVDTGDSRSEAVSEFKKKHESDLIFHGDNSRWISFIPVKLFVRMPDVDMSRKWQGSNRKPIAFFYQLYDNKIKLIVEVGPMLDQELREKIIGSLFKNVRDLDKGSKSPIYTRIWSRQYRIDPENGIGELGADVVLEEMNKLLFSLEVEGVNEGIEKTLTEVFTENNPQDEIPYQVTV